MGIVTKHQIYKAQNIFNFILTGVGSRVKYGSGAGQLQKIVDDETSAVSSINFGYTDSCLIGAFIASETANAGQVSK